MNRSVVQLLHVCVTYQYKTYWKIASSLFVNCFCETAVRYVRKQSNWCSNMAVCWLSMWTNTAVLWRTSELQMRERAKQTERGDASDDKHAWFVADFILHAGFEGFRGGSCVVKFRQFTNVSICKFVGGKSREKLTLFIDGCQQTGRARETRRFVTAWLSVYKSFIDFTIRGTFMSGHNF